MISAKVDVIRLSDILRARHTMERALRNAFILIEAIAVCLALLFPVLTIVESCYVVRLAFKLLPHQTSSLGVVRVYAGSVSAMCVRVSSKILFHGGFLLKFRPTIGIFHLFSFVSK